MKLCADAFLLLCLLGLPGASPAAPDKRPAVEALASIWISACLDGRLQLSANGVREVSAGELETYWEPERRQRNARYFKIIEPAEAGLVITDYDPPTREGFKSECDLISRTHDLKPSWRTISNAVAGTPVKRIPGMDVYTIDNRAGGYRIEVHSWLLSIGHYSDKIVKDARARAKKPKVGAEDSPFE